MRVIILKNWDKVTGLLHFLLALGVTCQLFVALLMNDKNNLFSIHKILGFSLAVIVLLHWLWIYHKKVWLHFFPFNKSGLLAMRDDLFGLTSCRHLPQAGTRAGLPGLVHGFGLLTVTVMAASGIVMFVSFKLGHKLPVIKSTHKFFATLLWVYWYGHIAMALLHYVQGRRRKPIS